MRAGHLLVSRRSPDHRIADQSRFPELQNRKEGGWSCSQGASHRKDVMIQKKQVCGNCGKDNAPREKFCENCGYSLTSGPVSPITQASSNNTPSTTISTSRHITGSLIAGNILDKRYCIVEMIGKGGFGAVYKARDERFSSQPFVAIKEMSDSQLSPDEKVKALKDFHHEANLLVQLRHPNLPNVSNVFEEGGKAYLVMEFIEGKTLGQLQDEQDGPLDERLVMSWALQLCIVLDYLHTQPQPIIFRDMKPANVMVTSKGEVKLIDFGIARIFKPAVKKDTSLFGSQGYAPLEQYGREQSDARTDIYALGATLYDLLTGERPTDAPSRHVNPTLFSHPRELNPEIPPAVEAIILKAMANEPKGRYQTAADMYQAIVATGLVNSPPSAGLITSSPSLPTFPPPVLSQRGKRPSNRRRLYLITGLLILLLALVLCVAGSLLYPVKPPDTMKAWTAPNGELIGLSDGRNAFDTGVDRGDASLKTEASKKLGAGDKAGAKSLWNQAVGSDTSDAEALIYLENQRILDSGSPYITLVVGGVLTGSPSDISGGRNNLQGAYVAQKEYNDGLKLSGGKLVRLLIANAGSKPDYVTEVAGQIVQATKQDSTIIGVMGWSRSAYAHKAIDVLSSAHIPMVSATASADDLSGVSPYFFRVAPPNKRQTVAGAKYAEQQLHASRVALFLDPKDSFSSSLANDFKEQFVADGNQIVATENYTIGDKASLPTHLQSALNSNPDLIYFAGYPEDLTVLLVNLGTSQPNLQVLGGDSLYVPSGYPTSAKVGFSRLRFTAFAFFDEWDILGLNKPQFFSEYSNDFNPTGADHSAKPFGFTRADYGVILSYDAMYALFQGCQNVLLAHNTLTSTSLQQGLTEITGAKAIQGVSGQISFGSNGDPINKAIVVLYIDQEGHTHMLQPNGVLGCFVVGKCG